MGDKATQTKTGSDASSMQVCIDLPGEEFQCTRKSGVKLLTVVLRKHRDVIFELQLFKGMTYTVEAEHSDFYNARDKKLVEHQKKQKVSFKDGERLHLWVPRQFKGALLLKANGKLLGRYEPNQLDPARYDEAPATKPAPLMVVMKNEAAKGVASLPAASGTSATMPIDPFSPIVAGNLSIPPLLTLPTAAKQTNADEQSMHIVEVKPSKDIPREIAEFFKGGGDQTAVDPAGVLTRNWLIAQLFGAGGYYNDNRKWIDELWKQKFYLQKVVHKKAGVMHYIVFNGNQRMRELFNAARYGSMNSKVLAISGGAGSVKGMRHAAWDAAKGSLKKAGLLTVVLTITLDTAEWLADYEQRDPTTGKPKKDFFDLAAKIGIDLAKAGISAAIASVLVASVTSFLLTGGFIAAAPVALVVIGTIALTIFAGAVLDFVDKKLSVSDKLGEHFRTGAAHLQAKHPADYANYSANMSTVFAP